MPKVRLHMMGFVADNNKIKLDSYKVYTDEGIVKLPQNKDIEVPEETEFLLTYGEFYMGVPIRECHLLAVAKEGVPIVKITTPLGSYIQGEIEVAKADKIFKIVTLSKDKEVTPKEFKRRIIKWAS